MSENVKSNFADWWFLNGGGIHRAEKSEDATALAGYAKHLPKLAWDEQQKTIDALRADMDLLMAVVEAAEDINKMLSQKDPPDLETATNTTLALEEALTRWHCR